MKASIVALFLSLSAQGAELGSDAYILSHFHYANSARLTNMQRNEPPSGERVKPCSLQVLPASPGQATKAYYADAVISFQTQVLHAEGKLPPKLPTMDKEGVSTHQSYCRIVNKSNPGLNRETGTKWCTVGKAGRFIMMSDVFQDSCGNYFRGVWETATLIDSYVHGKPQYTSEDEHSVTSSIGHFDGMQRDPQYPGSAEFMPGPTGPVDAKRFLFFIAASEKDIFDANRVLERQLAPNGKYYRCKDGTFSMEKKYCVE
jgi:hypothetical protein